MPPSEKASPDGFSAGWPRAHGETSFVAAGHPTFASQRCSNATETPGLHLGLRFRESRWIYQCPIISSSDFRLCRRTQEASAGPIPGRNQAEYNYNVAIRVSKWAGPGFAPHLVSAMGPRQSTSAKWALAFRPATAAQRTAMVTPSGVGVPPTANRIGTALPDTVFRRDLHVDLPEPTPTWTFSPTPLFGIPSATTVWTAWWIVPGPMYYPSVAQGRVSRTRSRRRYR
jgi:hypothetical protein